MKSQKIQRQSFKPSNFEGKWQEQWKNNKTFSPDLDSPQDSENGHKGAYYTLMMFPYPSAEGMHVGNMYAHTGADIHGRFKRMQGYDTFEPIGLDGFGIHSENYAMKVGRHPKDQAKISEKNFYRQMHATGSGFDWQRNLETYDPAYYKWTQWLFTQMFKAGLAYKEKAVVNFCPSCKTVLSDEQVIAGECERCGSIVEKKELEQWFFRITNYAGRLLDNLSALDWSEKVKIAQKNWIGRSKGALITFPIADFRLSNGEKPQFVFIHGFHGKPENDFWPWLKYKVEESGCPVYAPQLPNSGSPNIQEQVEFLLKEYTFNENTVIVTHSLGGVVALKLLPQLKTKIAKLVFVAPPLRNEFIDGKKRPQLEVATDWKFDFASIKENAKEFTVIADKNDPKVPQSHGKELAEQLDAQLVTTPAEFPHFNGKIAKEVLKQVIPSVDVFTTRPDTVFGATFVVIAPEHPIVNKVIGLEYYNDPIHAGNVKTYVDNAIKKSENERIAEGTEKTGVFTGLYMINPANGKKIPVWVADYVIGGYGTSAVMAVPGHDQRDYDFAKKYNLPIVHVIMPSYVDTKNPPQEGKENTKRTVIIGIVYDPKAGKYLILDWKKQGWKTFITGGVEEGEDLVDATRREIAEETGYTDISLVQELGGPTEAFFYASHKGVNRQTKAYAFLFELQSNKKVEVAKQEHEQHEVVWMTKEEVESAGLRHGEFNVLWERVHTSNTAYVGHGLLLNSGDLDGYHSSKDSDKILAFISEEGIGEVKDQYHLRDWLISRQRYWGPPIPMIFCKSCATQAKSWFSTEEAKNMQSLELSTDEKGEKKTSYDLSGKMAGWYPVPDEELPLILPDIQDFRPEGTGVSPLANHPEFYETVCPGCKGKATRETDVSDTFLDSSWYFLRYLATDWDMLPFPSVSLSESLGNDSYVKSSQQRSQFLPVNIYIGGAEHAVLHLLYARFVTMMLHDLGYIDFEEPFSRFYAHGLLIKEGAKMSKSKGNVIVPDEYIAKYGADTLRSYLMFLGPFNQGGDFYDSGIEGMFRFLRRVWVLITERVSIGKESDDITRMRHKTIFGVTKDLESFGYNTALSKLMELYNAITRGKGEFDEIILTEETVESFLKMLAPFAPHMTEELYQQRNGAKKENKFESIHCSSWPVYDQRYLVNDSVVLVIQVNGKRRGELHISTDEPQNQKDIEAQARTQVEKHLTSEIKKIIYIPGKIINFVI